MDDQPDHTQSAKELPKVRKTLRAVQSLATLPRRESPQRSHGTSSRIGQNSQWSHWDVIESPSLAALNSTNDSSKETERWRLFRRPRRRKLKPQDPNFPDKTRWMTKDLKRLHRILKFNVKKQKEKDATQKELNRLVKLQQRRDKAMKESDVVAPPLAHETRVEVAPASPSAIVRHRMLKQRELDPVVESWMRKRAILVKKPVKEKDLQRNKHMFNLIDLDGSGVLEIDELQDAMNFVGIHLKPSELVERMKLIDVNYDGDISFDEYVMGLSTIDEWDELLRLRHEREVVIQKQQEKDSKTVKRMRDLLKQGVKSERTKETIARIEHNMQVRHEQLMLSRAGDMPFHMWIPAYHRARTLEGVREEGPAFLSTLEETIIANQKKPWGVRQQVWEDITAVSDHNENAQRRQAGFESDTTSSDEEEEASDTEERKMLESNSVRRRSSLLQSPPKARARRPSLVIPDENPKELLQHAIMVAHDTPGEQARRMAMDAHAARRASVASRSPEQRRSSMVASLSPAAGRRRLSRSSATSSPAARRESDVSGVTARRFTQSRPSLCPVATPVASAAPSPSSALHSTKSRYTPKVSALAQRRFVTEDLGDGGISSTNARFVARSGLLGPALADPSPSARSSGIRIDATTRVRRANRVERQPSRAQLGATAQKSESPPQRQGDNLTSLFQRTLREVHTRNVTLKST